MNAHIGFTGTRHGMSTEQRDAVDAIVAEMFGAVTAHHGLCVGADEEFQAITRVRGIDVIGHPGPDWPHGDLCARVVCLDVLDPLPHMKRNAAIVAASSIMIAAPHEPEPQPCGGTWGTELARPPTRGGTWATIGMARKALRAGKLQRLYVVGRNGQLMDHERWKL